MPHDAQMEQLVAAFVVGPFHYTRSGENIKATDFVGEIKFKDLKSIVGEYNPINFSLQIYLGEFLTSKDINFQFPMFGYKDFKLYGTNTIKSSNTESSRVWIAESLFSDMNFNEGSGKVYFDYGTYTDAISTDVFAFLQCTFINLEFYDCMDWDDYYNTTTSNKIELIENLYRNFCKCDFVYAALWVESIFCAHDGYQEWLNHHRSQ